MAQILVRNIEDEVKTRLQRRAARHGLSMEQEVRDILRNAALAEDVPEVGLGTQISAMFREIGLTEPIEELRGYPVEPITFEE